MDFNDFVAHVKGHVSIEEYMSRYGVSLSASGYRLKGLCPFHHEKTPSFIVDANTQSYKCFGCGESGDIFDFIIAKDSLTFMETLKMLAEENSIEIPSNIFEKNDDDTPQVDVSMIRECLRASANFFYRRFKELDIHHPAKQEVVSRGLSLDGSTRYGYAPESWDSLYKHLLSQGFSDDVMLEAGVVKKRTNGHGCIDFWRNRLIFFVLDIRKNVIGFSGRALNEGDMPKYNNSPDTPVFKKSKSFYNIENAKDAIMQEHVVFITEGQFDTVSCRESGIENVVASLGTAFTPAHAHILSRFIGSEGYIVFSFDGDKAGLKAIQNIFVNIPEIHSYAKVVIMPTGLDPCDYREKYGSQKLQDYLLNKQVPIVDYIINYIRETSDMTTSEGRGAFVRRAVKSLVHVHNPVIYKQALREVALWSLSSLKDIDTLVENERTSGRSHSVKNNDTQNKKVRTLDSDDNSDDIIRALDSDFETLVASKVLATYMRAGGRNMDKPSPTIIPEPLQGIVHKIQSYDRNVFYPELFDQQGFVKHILSDDFMPMTPSMNENDLVLHYNFLVRKLDEIHRKSIIDNIHAQTYQALDGEATVKDLILARKIEQEQLEQYL